MQRRLACLFSAALALACGGDGTGPNGSAVVGPIGPFPTGVSGKIALSTSVAITSGSRAYIETKLHVIDVAARIDHVAFTSQDVWVEGVTWAPDGEHLVVQTFQDQPPGPNGENRSIRQLELLSQDGGSRTVIFDGVGPEFHPSYGPDGRLAYFARWSNDPTAGIFIDNESVYPMSGGGDLNDYVTWMPSADALVFATGFLYRLSLADKTVAQILAPENGEVLTQPAVSPDGSRIALMRFGGSRQNEEIWTISATGSDATRLTAGFGDEYPMWVPGGAYIAFGRLGGSAPGIYVIPQAGGAPIRVVGVMGGPLAVAWSR